MVFSDDGCPIAFAQDLHYWDISENALETCCLKKYSEVKDHLEFTIQGRGFAEDEEKFTSGSMGDFQRKVWDAIMNIPKGEVRTYKEIAISIGRPNAYRAVGSACKHNPYPIDIPCHRVIPVTGGVGNYLGVVNCEKKKRLLKAEGVDVTLFNL